jgi:hypothetical protein
LAPPQRRSFREKLTIKTDRDVATPRAYGKRPTSNHGVPLVLLCTGAKSVPFLPIGLKLCKARSQFRLGPAGIATNFNDFNPTIRVKHAFKKLGLYGPERRETTGAYHVA